MQENDKLKFAEIMTGIGELYNKTISKPFLSIFFEALKEHDIESVVSAISAHVRNAENGQFFPKPADIIRRISGTEKDAAQVAWAKVDKAVRCVGPYSTVVFDDEIIHRVIDDMGGWICLGEKTEKDWPFIANEFRERYHGYKMRGKIDTYPRRLIGINDAENVCFGPEWYGDRGLPQPEPVLIGDAGKAVKILEEGSCRPAIECQTLNAGKKGKINLELKSF